MEQGSDRFTMEKRGSVVTLRWDDGVTITRADAVRSGEVLHELAGGEHLGLVVYVRKVVRIDPEARELIMNSDIGPKVALVVSDPMDAVITGFAHQSVSETRFFTSEDEALEWLLGDAAP